MSTAGAKNIASRPSLLEPGAHAAVGRAFVELFPAGLASERHLRGALDDVLDHAGSLVRAQLAYGILRGRGVADEASLSIAVAIEYFHTASLIFDDLPCMDDATVRRGAPCPHVVHGEAAAILAALALITRGYELLWQVLADLGPEKRLEGSRLVARCLGAGGILDGQAHDLHFRHGPDAESRVIKVAEGKTVSLVRLTLLLPALIAGAGERELEALDRLAHRWGLSYQILDDFKDRLLTRVETGKSSRMDRRRDRPNLPLAAGRKAALSRLDTLLDDARRTLGTLVGSEGDWRLLERLQSILEDERCAIRSRMTVAAPC